MKNRVKSAARKTRQAQHSRTGRFIRQRTNGANKTDPASTMRLPLNYSLNQILRPQSPFRWLMPNIAAITPQYIEMVLMGAMMGNNVQQWYLFDMMLKTWPELLACYDELTFGVLRKKIIFEPYHEENEKPSPSAVERMKVVSTAIARMQPDQTRDDCEIQDTIKDILDGWFRGIAVSEIIWQTLEDKQTGIITGPKATYFVDPCNYAFDNQGVLGLRPYGKNNSATAVWPYSTTNVQPTPAELEPFPPYKFLIAMHKASAGSVLGGALLRPLAWWWCAANFSSDWLLNLAQIFGLPFRWANYDPNAPQATVDAICTMLQNMGSAGWAAFPVGTTLELHQSQGGSDHSPQGELLDRADRYARLLLLGQTMTGTHGTTGKGGGQAFGVVEKDVKADRIDAAGKFATDVINEQLVKTILILNFGDTDEAPTMRFLEDQEAGLPEAQRDVALINGIKLDVSKAFIRKKYGLPEPENEADAVGGEIKFPEPQPKPEEPKPQEPKLTQDQNQSADTSIQDVKALIEKMVEDQKAIAATDKMPEPVQPQVINVSVDNKQATTKKSFVIKRADGTTIEGELFQSHVDT